MCVDMQTLEGLDEAQDVRACYHLQHNQRPAADAWFGCLKGWFTHITENSTLSCSALSCSYFGFICTGFEYLCVRKQHLQKQLRASLVDYTPRHPDPFYERDVADAVSTCTHSPMLLRFSWLMSPTFHLFDIILLFFFFFLYHSFMVQKDRHKIT